MTRTAFLDRDGTINREQGFVTAPDQLVILPGVVAALRRLAAADCRIVVVTNQSGIARGLYDERDLARVHATLHQKLEGLPYAYLHCPHHPDGTNAYGGPCDCRKPAPGLLHQARRLPGVSFEDGLLVGDSARDLLMGRGLPLRTVHVHSGKEPSRELAAMQAQGMAPAHSAPDLDAAVTWYLGRDR
ncbi:MAG: HAD-IIIA family hydrolase [Planctomycetes bacterium]|nr:HAD-IIIA family hydrolase [Planctomycetota bacterium]